MEETLSEARLHDEQQTVVFRLGPEFYGIDIFRVNEIIRLREITPIPRTEPHIRGLVNLRGKTIPVVDLRIRMNLPEEADTESTRIIVVETAHGNVGIVVDAVTEVASIGAESIDEAPQLVNDVAAEFVRGVAKRESDLVTLLDLDMALAA
jgi:purine-binding chemotaxis protein CheW